MGANNNVILAGLDADEAAQEFNAMALTGPSLTRQDVQTKGPRVFVGDLWLAAFSYFGQEHVAALHDLARKHEVMVMVMLDQDDNYRPISDLAAEMLGT